jgi:Smg protein
LFHFRGLYTSIVMKEDMFEILMYLFEHHMQSDCNLHLTEMLLTELEHAGFAVPIIDKALDWLEGLLVAQDSTMQTADTKSIRIFSSNENLVLSTKVRGFLFVLQQKGIFNTVKTRELVIDRLMAINDPDIDLPQVKWVVLLVLFNQPNEEAALACMENLVLDSPYGLH